MTDDLFEESPALDAPKSAAVPQCDRCGAGEPAVELVLTRDGVRVASWRLCAGKDCADYTTDLLIAGAVAAGIDTQLALPV